MHQILEDKGSLNAAAILLQSKYFIWLGIRMSAIILDGNKSNDPMPFAITIKPIESNEKCQVQASKQSRLVESSGRKRRRIIHLFSLFHGISYYHEGTFCCITNMCHSKTPIKPIDCRHRGGTGTRYLFQNTFWWSESLFSER